MRVAIDAVGNGIGGGGVVLGEIVRSFAENVAENEIVTFVASGVASKEDSPKRPFATVDIGGAGSGVGRIVWAIFGAPLFSLRYKVRLFVGVNGIALVNAICPAAVFVQQALPYSPEAMNRCSFRRRFRMRVIKWLTIASVRSARCVWVQTNSMKEALCRSVPQARAKIAVIAPSAPKFDHEGVEPRAWPRDSKREVLLYVGNNETYKNLGVICTGMERIEHEAVLCLTVAPPDALRTDERIRYLGRLAREELRGAYERATVVVMPSLVESLGLPLLEAMRMGVAVLAADRPYARDVCGDAAVYFDPTSSADFALKADQLLRDETLRTQLINRGRAIVAALDVADPYGAMAREAMALAREACDPSVRYGTVV